MPRRRRLLGLLLLLLLLGGAAGAAGVWYFFFSGPAPEAASIDDAADAVDSTPDPNAPVTIDGAWAVDTTVGSFADYSGTWAGFRVAEVLDNIGDTEAVGRTPTVSGQLTLDGGTLTATSISVDLTTITSDRSRRDPAIQRALETGSFPMATFELTDSIELPEAPVDGVTYDVTANGTLTIHGVAQPVAIDLQARLVGDTIVVVGSADLTFSDFGVEMPRAPIVLSVADNGTIEFQLFFTKATA